MGRDKTKLDAAKQLFTTGQRYDVRDIRSIARLLVGGEDRVYIRHRGVESLHEAGENSVALSLDERIPEFPFSEHFSLDIGYVDSSEFLTFGYDRSTGYVFQG